MGVIGMGKRARRLVTAFALATLSTAAMPAQQVPQNRPVSPVSRRPVVPRAQASAAAAGPFVKEGITKKITEHVWVIPDQNVPVVPNVGIIAGSRATLVIDPGLGIRNGQAVLRETAKISKNTELYVASTHFHPEHATGVAAFPASAKYIVSQIQQKDIEELGPAMVQLFASRSPVMGELLQGAQFRKPDITFDKQYELDLGGVKATFMQLGPTHTRGDTAIWVQDGKDGVIFAGDIVMNQTIVAFGQYSSAKAWLDALAQLARLRPQNQDEPPVLVPSHGAIGDANLIAHQRGFFQAIEARVKQLKESGKGEDEIVKAVTDEFKDRYKMWNNPDRIEAVVKNVYKENS